MVEEHKPEKVVHQREDMVSVKYLEELLDNESLREVNTDFVNDEFLKDLGIDFDIESLRHSSRDSLNTEHLKELSQGDIQLVCFEEEMVLKDP